MCSVDCMQILLAAKTAESEKVLFYVRHWVMMAAALQMAVMGDTLHLTGGCRAVARHVFRRVTQTIPASSEFAEKLSNSCAGSRDSAPIRQIMAESSRCFVNIGQG